MKFCGNCGNPLASSQKFCTKCGSKNPLFDAVPLQNNTDELMEEKLKLERIAFEKLQQEKIIQEQLERERKEQEQLRQEQQKHLRELQEQQALNEKQEQERLVKEHAERERLEKEKLEQLYQAQQRNIYDEASKQSAAKEKLLKEIQELEELNKRKEELAAKALAETTILNASPLSEQGPQSNSKKYLIAIFLVLVLIGNGIFAYLFFSKDKKTQPLSKEATAEILDSKSIPKTDTISNERKLFPEAKKDEVKVPEMATPIEKPKTGIAITPSTIPVSPASPVSLSESQIKRDLVGKTFSSCPVTVRDVSEIRIISKTLLGSSNATSKNYRIKIEVNQGSDNDFIVPLDMYYLVSAQNFSLQRTIPGNCEVNE